MKILFLHGWHSVVGGVKPTWLQNQGFDVCNPSLDDDDFGRAVLAAQSTFDDQRPDVVVGSSRGGAVAMNIDSGDTPLVLLCPAWKRWGSASRITAKTLILHSRQDDVIPFADSKALIDNSQLPVDHLLEVGNDHRLADRESLSVMTWACHLLHRGERIPTSDVATSPTTLTDPSNAMSQPDASYVCDACGEEIVIPIDRSAGCSQTYVEDCPVCCRANIIHVHLVESGAIDVSAELE